MVGKHGAEEELPDNYIVAFWKGRLPREASKYIFTCFGLLTFGEFLFGPSRKETASADGDAFGRAVVRGGKGGGLISLPQNWATKKEEEEEEGSSKVSFGNVNPKEKGKETCGFPFSEKGKGRREMNVLLREEGQFRETIFFFGLLFSPTYTFSAFSDLRPKGFFLLLIRASAV